MTTASGAQWLDADVHFIDFEGNIRSGVLEYGVATLRGGRLAAASTRLCAARGRVLAEETAVHGLGDADVAGARPMSDDWEYFNNLRAGGPLAAHSAGAENSLIRSVWPYPRTCPDFARPGGRVAEWGPWIDTASLCREVFPGMESVKLEGLVAAFGLQAELDALACEHCPPARRRYHAALYDALAGALVLLALAAQPALQGAGLPRLLTLSTQSGARRDELQQGTLF